MKFQVHRLFVIAAIGLFCVAASTLPAAAQTIYKGQFTLPHEVRWQNAKLPAGNYTFSLPSLAPFSAMTITGPDGSVREIAHVNSGRRSDGPSVLILEQRDGTYFVREMDLSEISVQIRYSVPKQSRSDERFAQASTTEKILVAAVVK